MNGFDCGLAGGEITGIELAHRNAGLGMERLRRSIIAGIAGDHGPPGGLQRAADLSPNAARSARHKCDTAHTFAPSASISRAPTHGAHATVTRLGPQVMWRFWVSRPQPG